MSMVEHRARKFEPRSRTALPVDARAVDDIRFIRQTMEQSVVFTAVPGWGMVIVGATALPAAWLAAHFPADLRWVEIWICEAVFAVALSIMAIQNKAVRRGLPWTSGPGRKVALSFLAPLLAAAVLTLPLLRANLGPVLPALWMLLYGVGVITGGAFSVGVVRLMGVCFMAAGAASLALPISVNWAMALSFGGLHIAFGVWIARRHGG
jgi:hypothetical protein